MSAAPKPAAGDNADPILQFLAADVPLRCLLEHGAQRLDWLDSLDAPLIIATYPDGQGGMVVEEVTKLRLLELGFKSGWVVDDPGDCEAICWKETIIWEDEGDSSNKVPGIWFAHGDCCEWDISVAGAPVTIPAARLEELRREAAEHFARLAAEREEREAEAAAKREEEIRQGHEILVAGRIALHRKDGVEITREQAEREIEEIASGLSNVRLLAAALYAAEERG